VTDRTPYSFPVGQWAGYIPFTFRFVDRHQWYGFYLEKLFYTYMSQTTWHICCITKGGDKFWKRKTWQFTPSCFLLRDVSVSITNYAVIRVDVIAKLVMSLRCSYTDTLFEAGGKESVVTRYFQDVNLTSPPLHELSKDTISLIPRDNIKEEFKYGFWWTLYPGVTKKRRRGKKKEWQFTLQIFPRIA